MKLIILFLFLTSCSAYKEQSGQKIERWNTIHMKKIHGPKVIKDSTGYYRSYADFKHSKK